MKTLSFIASDGVNILWDRLSRFFEGASVLRIASAFLGAGDEITSWVDQGSDRRVEIVVRLEYPTNPESVVKLLKHPRVAIRAANSTGMPFHEKLFLAIDSAGECIGAYIGSANWTQGGLRKNHEAGVWVAEEEVLRQMEAHFKAGFQDALQISDQMLAQLRSDPRWQASPGKRLGKDRGTLISSWRDLRPARDRRFFIKQNGIGAEPFVEGEDESWKLIRNNSYSSQTFSKIPSSFEPGLGFIVSRIARRRDGSPDRVIYGRGRIGGFDRKLWKLPDQYLAALGPRGVDPKEIKYLKRWPEILWLVPAEYINYPRECDALLWLSDFMRPAFFQGGFRRISGDIWTACNRALDERTKRFGLLPLDRDGIWWNQHVKIADPDDPLFMTKARVEEMNLGSGDNGAGNL
jgi:hypothetical protein